MSESIDWEYFGVYGDRPHLPADWQHVTDIDSGGGYDWTTLHAFWSPTDRQYYWHGGSGCSCDSWGSNLRHPSDFQVGSKEDLVRGIREFASWGSVSADKALDAVAAVHRFRGGFDD